VLQKLSVVRSVQHRTTVRRPLEKEGVFQVEPAQERLPQPVDVGRAGTGS
jgi:hypothetical protein